ncbi:MAG: DUF2182 domain-containing protein [Gemmatimonadetes bacterium]|nr:DUF2182 domain-containing protein [Gemmatimonadota bacterium]MYB07478.1 DUF2182 domain-containing protein [Gemmatimonadota bacterium]MYE17768.1 DUF2182 domain-containing protein [Gemmatimonadota bacterium]MYG21187.1 DUF2182 domain-containing protein [Gemmatimonadota bacterium]MYJ40608.1 DUF2182 domain-containing protein [Gemmatimonadota bacterium]
MPSGRASAGPVSSYPPVLAMWLAMTGLMMAPVVYPWLRALNRVAAGPAAAVTPFLGGYMLAWAGFGAAAAGVHVSLAAMAFPVPFRLEAPALSAAVLMLTGAYQLTPLKGACLSHCRSPAGFLLSKWRDGPVGQTRMGFEHGLHCLGCCWALMALALVVGMGSLAWMGVLMAVMVAETALPFGARLTRPVGAALIVAGVVVAATGGPA